MVRKIKSIIKVLKYRIKFRRRNIKVDWSCQVSSNDFECEGMNVLHRDVTFRGKIGYGSYIGEHSNLNAVIGRYCSISSDVKTISGTHPTHGFVSTHPAFFSTNKPVSYTHLDVYKRQALGFGGYNAKITGACGHYGAKGLFKNRRNEYSFRCHFCKSI